MRGRQERPLAGRRRIASLAVAVAKEDETCQERAGADHLFALELRRTRRHDLGQRPGLRQRGHAAPPEERCPDLDVLQGLDREEPRYVRYEPAGAAEEGR